MNTNILNTTVEETSENLREVALDPDETAKTVTSRKSNKSNIVSQERLNILNVSAIQGIEETYGPRKTHQDPMTPKFLSKLEKLCDEGLFPVPMVNKLVATGLNCPHTLINTFGGGITNLAMHLVYMKITLFLHGHPRITRALFTISRQLLNVPFNIVNIDPEK